jgi:hypothetical protein
VPSTLTVTNNLDSGAGSLRAEIAAAKRGDTIVFAPNLDGQTITLTSGELLISRNLTITGPVDRKLTVSGNNASRVFEIGKNIQVTLSALTISYGLADSNGGGGILNHSTLTVTNSILSTNSAPTLGYGGGGIENSASPVAQRGGGIDNDGGHDTQPKGTVTLTNSILSGNSTSGSGGGIDNRGTMTISGTTLSGNTAVGKPNTDNGNGGGIMNLGTLTITGSTLSGNTATAGLVGYAFSGVGGGIDNAGGNLTISSSTLSGNNAAEDGGGIWTTGSMTVSSCTLSGNSAGNDGGGIYAYGGTVTLTNDTMQSNTATSYGGGIYIRSVAAVYLDQFTVANIINNTDSSNGSTANIDGSYTLLP